MESEVRIFKIPADTGNPVEVFFPGKGAVAAVYENGYIFIPLSGKSQTGEWLVTDLFGAALGGMMRVCFWDAGARWDARTWEEALLVEAYGEVGNVYENRIAGRDDLRVGPVHVAAVYQSRGAKRALALLREEGEGLQEELQITGRAVAFCRAFTENAELDVVVVRDSLPTNERLWIRFTEYGVKRYRLPARGTVELGCLMAAILSPSGEVFLAMPFDNVARRVADGAWAVGLSPDGDRLVMLRRKADGWVWDFRLALDPRDSPCELQAMSPEELGIVAEQAIVRISPSLRWAVAIFPGHVVVWSIPRPKIWA